MSVTKQMKKVKYKLRKDKKGTIVYYHKRSNRVYSPWKKKQLITKTTKTTILKEKSNKANNRILRGPGRGHNPIVPGPTRAMTRWVRWVANDSYFSLDTVIIKEGLANRFQEKQKSAWLGLNGDPPNLKQNWIQGWQYAKGLIYLRLMFRLTKLVFLRARATPKKNTKTAPKVHETLRQ